MDYRSVGVLASCIAGRRFRKIHIVDYYVDRWMLMASSTQGYRPIFGQRYSANQPRYNHPCRPEKLQKNAASAYNFIEGRWRSHRRRKIHLGFLRFFDDVQCSPSPQSDCWNREWSTTPSKEACDHFTTHLRRLRQLCPFHCIIVIAIVEWVFTPENLRASCKKKIGRAHV